MTSVRVLRYLIWAISLSVLAALVWVIHVVELNVTEISQNRLLVAITGVLGYGYGYGREGQPDLSRLNSVKDYPRNCFSEVSDQLRDFESTSSFDLAKVCTDGTRVPDPISVPPVCVPFQGEIDVSRPAPFFPTKAITLIYVAGSRQATGELYRYLQEAAKWPENVRAEVIGPAFADTAFFTSNEQTFDLHQCEDFSVIKVETMLPRQ